MLTQQLGRYLFKTFRILLADPNAPMSSENRTRGYILKVSPSVSRTFDLVLTRLTAVHLQPRGQGYLQVRRRPRRPPVLHRRLWTPCRLPHRYRLEEEGHREEDVEQSPHRHLPMLVRPLSSPSPRTRADPIVIQCRSLAVRPCVQLRPGHLARQGAQVPARPPPCHDDLLRALR